MSFLTTNWQPGHFGYDIEFVPVQEQFGSKQQERGCRVGLRLPIQDLPDLSRGAAFLGTGGGGNPYVGG